MNWFKIIQKLFEPNYINVQLDLTNHCNLRCTHCYHPHHLNTGSLSVEEWLEAINKIETFCRKINAQPRFFLCGGEPTLAEVFPAAIKLIRKKFPTSLILVLTNGTTLNRPLKGGLTALQLIKENMAEAQISLDGSDEVAHDRIRGKGAFKKARDGIRLLRENDVPTSIQAVLSRPMASQIPDFFSLCKDLDVQEMNFVRFIEEGMAIKYAQSFEADHSPHLLGNDLREAMASILASSKKTGISTSTDGPLWALMGEGMGDAGRLGFYDLIVDYQGLLKISSRTSVRIGDVLKDDIWRIFQESKLLKSLRQGEIEGCSKCRLFEAKKCSGDRNVAFAASGSYTGPDIGCWKWREENGVA